MHPTLTEPDVKTLIDYIFTLKPKEKVAVVASPQEQEVQRTIKPGFMVRCTFIR